MRIQHYRTYRIESANLEPVAAENWESLFSQLPYFQSWNSWCLRKRSTSNLRPLCTSVSRTRVEIAQSILSTFLATDIPPYMPATLDYGEVNQTLLPPVVLKSFEGTQGIILDGMHRLFSAAENASDLIYVLEIDYPKIVLPGSPQTWDNVQLLNHQPAAPDKFVDYNPEGFRKPFTTCLNGEWLWTHTKSREETKK